MHGDAENPAWITAKSQAWIAGPPENTASMTAPPAALPFGLDQPEHAR